MTLAVHGCSPSRNTKCKPSPISKRLNIFNHLATLNPIYPLELAMGIWGLLSLTLALSPIPASHTRRQGLDPVLIAVAVQQAQRRQWLLYQHAEGHSRASTTETKPRRLGRTGVASAAGTRKYVYVSNFSNFTSQVIHVANESSASRIQQTQKAFASPART